jgi:UDP-GlcNAc:undecaprenyl-phosphate/decaprenyl-phosphate GlcNAc-1-phosphate transferase
MNWWPMIVCALVGMGIALLTVPQVLKAAKAGILFQRGQERHHIQQKPVPRLGGLALAAAFIGVEIFVTFVCPEQHTQTPNRVVVILSSLAMFALGFWDDLQPLGAKRKLLVQIVIALTVCALGISIQQFKVPFTSATLDLGGWGVFLTVLWLVGFTNLINLIDGADGLAGGICLMLMILLAYVACESGTFENLVSGMAGALLGFLWFNFPPARIYLGDGGAYFLGFQIGLFAIVNSHKGTVFTALAAPLFVLALPILDATLAIVRRSLHGLPIFRPDRRHLHHHLLQMGFSRRRVVLSFYFVTAIFLAMGFAAYWSRGNLIPALLGIATIILLFCADRLRFSQDWFAVGRIVGNSLQMRKEVHYAMSLTRWIELEGGRCQSAEELWPDFVFAAQRLGFSSVKMTLADGSRIWEPDNGHLPTHSVVQLLNGGMGTLELKAHTCCKLGTVPTPPNQPCERSFCHCVANERVFEIFSDLLAEGWVKAVSGLQNGDHAPLRFDIRRRR